MKISYFGHSCFALESEGYRLIIDPYTRVQGYPELPKIPANAVYASHGHFDHNYFDAVSLSAPSRPTPFKVETIASYHDERKGALRGENKIHVFKAEGMSAVHLGDLGHLPDKDTVDAAGKCDILMIPVGGCYTIDGDTAFRAAEFFAPRFILPMHYRKDGRGFDEISEPEIFLKHYPKSSVKTFPKGAVTIEKGSLKEAEASEEGLIPLIVVSL